MAKNITLVRGDDTNFFDQVLLVVSFKTVLNLDGYKLRLTVENPTNIMKQYEIQQNAVQIDFSKIDSSTFSVGEHRANLKLIDTLGRVKTTHIFNITVQDEFEANIPKINEYEIELELDTDGINKYKNYKELYNKPSINGVELIDNKSLDELGIQPAGNYSTYEYVDGRFDTVNTEINNINIDIDNTNSILNNKANISDIPTRVSQLVNDEGYLTEHQDISNLATKEELSNKQDKLIAGSGIDITNNIISNTQTSAEWGNIQGTLSNQTDLQTVLDNKQDVITDLATIREGANKGSTALQSYTETDPVYTSDKPNIALKSEIPTKVSSLTNDKGYQTASDVAGMIASIPQFELRIVEELPVTGQKMVLYLVPKTSASGDNVYDEYIWIESTSSFELIGSTTVDLGDYYTKTDTDGLLELKQDIIADLATIREGANKGATALQSVPSEYVTETELNAKGYLTSYTETDPVYTADKPNLATKTELQNGLNTKQDKGNYALKSEIPTVPTKTSELTNDSGFITNSYHDSTKQDKLTAGDNITIVNNVISATGGGGGGGSVDIVQTTGNSTTSVMSQKATTDMPAFKEVIAPTKMLKGANTQYCTSYDTFDYEDIKVAQVYCRQAYNSYGISHNRRGDIRYTSAISLYKDSNNYLSIYFKRNKLAVINRKGNVTVNEVDLGQIDSGDTSINKPENTAWCAEINLREKTCAFYVMRNGQLSPFGEVVDISTWDLSHLDTFNIVFGCSEYFGDSFCYYCLLNEKIEIDKIINTPIEYGKYNCYDTYFKNDIKPLQVTGIYADSTSGGAVAGTLITEYDNFHKVFSFSLPESTGTSPYLGLYGTVQGNQHKGQNCIIKCKFLELAEGAGLKLGANLTYIYKGTELVYTLISNSNLFVPELNVEYTFVINQVDKTPTQQYLFRGVGNFTMETLDMYYMVPQSANICAETWDGNFFRGVLPFVGTNVMFSNNYSLITTSRTGLGVPQYFQTTDSNGNIYMYNGTTWKQISN